MGELTGKVRPVHLRRAAWVYVRQSSMAQVHHHTESLARQYELAERAATMGWAAETVRVVDEDLGRSGADASARSGFQALVAAVGLGQVGIVLGIEVSRLARNNADWYHLLDLCALTDTLIADADGLYHPGDYNDRLVLGLKGTMSEAELHLLRSRLDAGLRHKAARGDLRQGLPVGFDYDEDGRVVMSPDEAVTEAIATVLRRFAELGTARQVLLSMRGDGLLLPRRSAGARRVRWAEATYPAVHDLLSNPVYAGAFVFGRTKVERRVDEAGKVATRTREVPLEEWEVCIPDHHPGFISWETYLANRETLRSNWRAPAGEGGGAPREGRASCRASCAVGGAGGACRSATRPGRDRVTCARGPFSSMGRGAAARASAAVSWKPSSLTRSSPCSSPPPWRPPPRRSPRPKPTTGAACGCSRRRRNGLSSRQNGPGASSTPASRRTASWPAPSNEHGRNASRPSATPRPNWLRSGRNGRRR